MSEPAEPTTRDAVLARVIEAANDQVDDDWTTGDTLAFREYFGERLATRLADLGLLADPAQTTELEAIEDAVDEFQVRDADGPVPNVSLAERVRVLFDEWREVTAERDEARAQRNEAMETAGQLRDEVHEHQVAAANLYGRVFVALGLSITAPWAGLADAAGHVRAERDALSLLLRGMARKLVACRKWALKAHRDQDWVLNRVRAALGTPDGRAVSVHAAEVRAERDERQARIDRAMAEIAAWWGTAQRADRVLMAVKSILSDLNLAALVGDQPKAEEPKPRCCIGPFADGTHAPGCLDACQDCGGDEAGPRRCQCGDVDPVCTCTPSRCDYDGYPLDGPACLPCGQRPVGKPCLAIDDTPRAVEEAADAAEPHHSPPPDPASLTEGEA